MKRKALYRNRVNHSMATCLLMALMFGSFLSLTAQNVSFNKSGTDPDPSAMLDVSATDKGVLIPRMTTADRLAIPSPANGLMVFQTDPPRGFYAYFSALNRWSRITQDSTLSLSDVLMAGNNANAQDIINVNRLTVGNSSLTARLKVSDPTFPNLRLTSGTVSTLSNAENSGVIELMENDITFESGGYGFQMRYIGSTNDRFQMRSAAGGGIDTLLTIMRGSGRMGIRTDNPQNQLHINSSLPTILRLERDGTGETFMQYVNSNYDLTTGINAGGDFGIQNTANTFGSKFLIDNAGNVGIAQTSPVAKLHLSTTSKMSQINESNNTDGTWLALGNSSIGGQYHHLISTGATNVEGAGKLLFGYGSSATITNITMTMDDANVGINEDTPATTLHVNHPSGISNGFSLTNSTDPLDRWHFYVWTTNNLTLYFNNATMGEFSSVSGAYTTISDQKFKKNIIEAESVIEKLNRLQVKEYHFLSQKETEPKTIGFIAQELKEEFPSLVTVKEASEESPESIHLVNYSGLSVVAIKAIQEQQEKINELRKRIEHMEELISKIQNEE